VLAAFTNAVSNMQIPVGFCVVGVFFFFGAIRDMIIQGVIVDIYLVY